MSPTNSKPFKLKSSKSPPSTSQSDLNRRRTRLSSNENDAEFEEIRKTIRSAAGIKAAKQSNKEWNPVIKFLLDLEDDPTEELRIFPRFALWFLMLLTCWSRYLIVSGHEGMTMIHPYEHMRTVEAAHLSVHGFGFELNETSYGDPQLNETTAAPTARIYQRLFVSLLRLQKQLGLQSSSFMFCRQVHVAVSTLTPFFVYHFARIACGQCRDIAFMAANLVAFSKHLIIYACHPFSQSFFSPLLFLSVTIMYKVWPLSNSVSRSLILVLCGWVFGIVTYIQADSLVFLSTLFLLISPSNLTSKLQYLPTSLRLTSAFITLTGVMLGFQFGAVHDKIGHRFWFITPYELLKIRLQHNPDILAALSNFYMFLCASHVHWALLIGSVICSFIYLSYKQRWTSIFDNWIEANSHETLFKMTSKFTLASAVLLIYNVYPHQLVFSHDTMVLALISGASAVYLLYRGLYIYILTIANPQKTTKNVIKLIVYGELFLYMFESRLTMPSTTNSAHSISPWAHKGLNESAQVNWCLEYISRQEDVTGLFIDFPIEMTGGYSLLQKQITTASVVGSNFAEFNPQTNRFTNIYSLCNPQQFIKSIVNNTSYNYAIISGGRRFFHHGFRKVYNNTNVRVYKRSKSFTEKQKLDDLISKLGSEIDVGVTEEEAITLISIGLYDRAIERLELALEQHSSVLRMWQLLIYAANHRQIDADAIISSCKTILGTKCSEEIKFHHNPSKLIQLWNVTYRFM